MKRLYLACIILLVTAAVHAQEKTRTDQLFPQRPGLILNSNVSSLMEPEGGPSLGLEYRISERWAVGADVQGIFYKMPDTYEFEGARIGFRVQPEVKYFFKWGNTSRRHFYMSLMGMYKKVRYKDWDYEGDGDASKRKTIHAATGNMGMQLYLGRSHRFILDMYVGLGVRYRDTDPEGGEYQYISVNRDFLFNMNEEGYSPNATFGVRLGYRF